MATNYTKQNADALIDIIEAAYPRFVDNNRIVKMMPVNGELRHVERHLGSEDVLLLAPSEPAEETTLLLTSGEIFDQHWHLLYYKPTKTPNDSTIMDDVSGFAQNLMDTLIDNKDHASGYWHNLRIEFNSSAPTPENYAGDLYGFELILTMTVGKFP
jgi:hypothetical protein